MSAARAQPARTRATWSAVERQVAAAQARRPDRVARARRVTTARRDLRRALRVRASAQRTVHNTEVAAGRAARRLLDEDLSVSDVAVLTAVSRSAVKRLLRVAAHATDRQWAGSSTEPPADELPGPAPHQSRTTGSDNQPLPEEF